MESTDSQCTATRTAPATRRGAAMSHLTRRTRRWLGGLAFALVATVGLAVPPPAAACAWYDPICWVEEGIDYFTDLMEDAADLAWDVLTLDPVGAFHDLVDIVANVFCLQITLLDLLGADVAESMYNNSCDTPHGIAPEVLEKLGPYFKSSFTSVVVHENCDFSNRDAITLGEHIYFEPGEYNPSTEAGLALLAHELIHVLQYRQDGFGDFICRYWQECGIGAELSGESGVSCDLEQQAYMYQALVLEDLKKDGDGIFTCALDAQEWNGDNVDSHTCTNKELLDNCPADFNPGQEDSDGDGLGDVCDPGPVARLYDGANRSGVSQAFPIGSWDVHALAYIGNDRASSIAVDPGVVARLCAEDGLWGDCFDFHQGQDESTWFKSYAQILDNRTSSLSVTPGVTVYQYPNFEGNRWTYTPGSYNHAAFQRVLNDQLSSLITAPGVLVQLCSESGGWGDCITVEGDTKVATLPVGMNDRTSHIVVSKGVTVYADAHFEGERRTFAPGTYDVSALGGVGNDRISSLVVPPDLGVRLCSESGGWGTCRTFGGNVSLVGSDMDNRTSWLQVTTVDLSALQRPIGTLPMTLP